MAALANQHPITWETPIHLPSLESPLSPLRRHLQPGEILLHSASSPYVLSLHWVKILALPFTSYVVLAKLLHFPEPQFSHLYNGSNRSSESEVRCLALFSASDTHSLSSSSASP